MGSNDGGFTSAHRLSAILEPRRYRTINK